MFINLQAMPGDMGDCMTVLDSQLMVKKIITTFTLIKVMIYFN
jgi:hypothetical protein